MPSARNNYENVKLLEKGQLRQNFNIFSLQQKQE